MRVLIAPDCYGGTLSAMEAAAAIAAGWSAGDPSAELDLAPVSDGGPGFVEVLQAALGGRLLDVTVSDPLGRPVPAQLLLVDADGIRSAYVESAQACGLHLLAPGERDPERTDTRGVGELLAAALAAGADRVVIGLGGSGTSDAGAGAWSVLAGSAGLAGELARRELVVATDVDSPLLGLFGAAAVFGPQKGADRAAVARLDIAAAAFAARLQAEAPVELPAVATAAEAPGAGAAGGLGFLLLALGGRRVSGAGLVFEAAGLDSRAEQADLLVTGEGAYDAASLRGKITGAVAALAAGLALPCVVLAGQVSAGRREAAAAGITELHSMSELVGLPAALAEPASSLQALAARVAAQWRPR